MSIFRGRFTNPSISNYIIKGDKFYTEDNIEIFKIYVPSLPRAVTDAKLREYFEKFGTITSLDIVVKGTHSRPHRFAFIQYEKSESAASVLKQTIHKVNSKNLTAKGADSWKQPPPKPIEKPKEENEDGKKKPKKEEPVEPPPIFLLHEDCIEPIFKYLTLAEQYRFSKLCPLFQVYFNNFFKRKYKMFHVNQLTSITLMEWREILQHYGAHVKSIFYRPDYQFQKRFIEFVPQFCANLETIEIRSIGGAIHSDVYKKLGFLKQLTSVELNDCGLNDNVINALSRLPNLEYLNITENYDLTGRYLRRFKNLKTLSLENCANIQSHFFIEMCENSKNLISLNIKRCERLNDKSFIAMETHCKELKTLKISTNYCTENLHYIAKIPKLESLEIYCTTTQIRDKLFEELAIHKAEQLSLLKMYSANCLTNAKKEAIYKLKKLETFACIRCRDVDDDFMRNLADLPDLTQLNIMGCVQVRASSVLDFVKFCPKLEKINVAQCLQFQDQLIFDLVDVLKKKNPAVKKPCTIVVANTCVDEDILQNSVISENTGLLTLVFEEPEILLIEEDDDEYMLSDDEFYDLDDDLDDDVHLFGYDSDDVYIGEGIDDDDDDDDDDYDVGFNHFMKLTRLMHSMNNGVIDLDDDSDDSLMDYMLP